MGHLVLHTGGGIFTVELGEHGFEISLGHACEADKVLALKSTDSITEQYFEILLSCII